MNSMLYPRMTAARRAVSLDGMWEFRFDPEGSGAEKGWDAGHWLRDEADTCEVPVPASFADLFTEKEKREYTGDFWYERELFVPGEWEGKRLWLRFGSVTHRAQVFVNGALVAEHEGGFLPFSADITEVAILNDWNQVVVKANNELHEYSLPAGITKVLPSGRKMTKPYFDFFNYAGIHRTVWLLALPEISVEDFTVNHRLVGSDAEVEYEVRLRGAEAGSAGEPEAGMEAAAEAGSAGEPADLRVAVCVYDENGVLAAESEGSRGCIRIKDVRLWQVLDAYLYRFVIRVYKGGGLVDEYYDEIGIRTVEVQGTDILINGSPVYLKGFGKHEDSDVIGKGYSAGIAKRDFECMKWIGANSFRTSHYPYSEEIYQMADREGFLIIDEVAAVGMFQSLMNFAEAADKDRKSGGYFAKDTTPLLLKNHLAAVEELITRDKNHASVIMWSLLNEPETVEEAAVDYFRQVFGKAHEWDVQKRPRTFAMVASSLPDTCKCCQFCDVLSLNRYYGWYVGGGYEIEEAEAMFRKEMEQWKELKLEKPFIFTEFGADTNPAGHKLPSVMWSQEYQKEYLQMNFQVFDDYDFVKGEQIWNFADFQTTEGIMRMDGNKKGIFTRQRQPKDSAFFVKERWEGLKLDNKK